VGTRKRENVQTRCLAVCRECSLGPAGARLGAFVAPWMDTAKRDAWAEEHEASHGHLVRPVLGWMDARVAFRLAFPPAVAEVKYAS
jgi:hypothetical protein